MISIEIKNINDLVKKIGAMNTKKAIDTAIKKSIFMIERTAKINTPVDTWLLRNSYETEFRDLTWTLRNFREYAPFVEFRRGFLQKTLEEEEWNVRDIFDSEIDILLKTLD